MPDSHSGSENVLDISKIAGNVSDETKQLLGNVGVFLRMGLEEETTQFGDAIQSRLRVMDITVRKSEVEENKMEARVVMEIEVQEGVHHNVLWLCTTIFRTYTDSGFIHYYTQICSTQGAIFTEDAQLS